MEVYTLDSLLRRERVIDRFESLIWTERFQAFGDFELVTHSTLENRNLLKPGTQLAMNESYRAMTVETVEDKTDDEGRRLLTVQGKSFESILLDRIAKASMSSLTTNPQWTITDTPAAIMRKIFHDICVTGILDPGDVIPFIVEGTIMPTSTIPEPIDPIQVDIPPQTVYAAIKAIADVYNLGFRLLRNFDSSQLYWDVYAGSDRTSGQTTRTPVIFAPDLDNLQNTRELNSVEASKNVAYVFSPDGFAEVYPEGVPPDTAGFDRRVLLVDASDITNATTSDLAAALEQRGKAELSQTKAFQAFDGEVDPNSQYKYQRDYYLGDLIEMRNVDGVTNQMRVTEQIFVSDSEGDRSYPTLAINQYINSGSWLSWEANQTWFDLDADPVTWSELP